MKKFVYQQDVLIDWSQHNPGIKKVMLVDFFDTLMVRKIAAGEVFKKVNPFFAVHRQFAELFLSRLTSRRNPSIQDIVKWIPFWSVKNEIAAEISSLIPNKSLLDELSRLIHMGVEVVIVSDTYYSSQQLNTFLNEHPQMVASKIFASSDYGINKSQGLYELAIKEFKDENVEFLIVGDDLRSDGANAIKNNIDFCWLITEVIDNSNIQLVDIEEFAKKTLGALVEGFTKWLNIEIMDFKPDLVCFLSRDSLIMKEKWEALNKKETNSIYLAASRKIAIESGFLKSKPEKMRYVGQRSKLNNISIGEYGQDFLEYYQSELKSAKRIVLVDLGWNGTFQDALSNAFPDSDFKGLYLGILPHNKKNPLKSGFIFEPERYNQYDLKIVQSHIDILEVLFCSGEGTLISIKNGLHREKISLEDELIGIIQHYFRRGLITNSTDPVKYQMSDEILSGLVYLSSRAPSWFTKSTMLIRHKVSPFSEASQPLVLSSINQSLKMDRIWWKDGQRRLLKMQRQQNIFLYIVSVFSVWLVRIRLICRIALNSEDLKRVARKLIRLFNP